MKERTVPIRFNDELYRWLKDYARRKHSNMAAIITQLLVDQKENDELNQMSVKELRKSMQTKPSLKK